MNAVWVVEWNTGRVNAPWHISAVFDSKKEAKAVCERRQSLSPLLGFRIRKYIPEGSHE